MSSITGTWYNDAGSRLDLRVLPDGQIEGTFLTHLGKAPGLFRVVGLADPSDHEGSQSFGLNVIWNNDQMNLHSVTVWSGQYQKINNDEVLVTTWLLTQETCPEEDWASTLVGMDKFLRTPPAEPIETHFLHRATSHPIR